MGFMMKFLLSFTNDMRKLTNDHPLKVEFDKAIQDYCLDRWGFPVITSAPKSFDDIPLTIEDMRTRAVELIQETQRLESLPGAKRLYSIRKEGQTNFLFTDPSEKEARYWALSNPNDEHVMYEEQWVPDPLLEGRRRCIARKKLDVPTITAREQK